MTVADTGPTLKQVQGARSREEILDAAEQLMGARGYAASSISALSKASGLPASSIYWHFGSKSGVLGAVMERGSRRFFADVGEERPEPSDDPRERLHALLRRSIDAIRTHPQFLRLFMVLLLGAEGEHAQNDTVAAVRAEGARLLRHGLRLAYEPWGADVANRIADDLGDLALAMFDGLFIAVEAAPDEPDARVTALLDRAVTSLHSLATTLRTAD